jgi:hypothetical protein
VISSGFPAGMILLVVNILNHVMIMADMDIVRTLLGVFMLCPDGLAFDFSR